jgi:hypothetical protein
MAKPPVPSADLDDATEFCALPGCGQPRRPEFLGWHGDDSITSAYCEDHGPKPKVKRCSECGTEQSYRLVWPDGIPPAGVLKGKVGTVSVS